MRHEFSIYFFFSFALFENKVTFLKVEMTNTLRLFENGNENSLDL